MMLTMKSTTRAAANDTWKARDQALIFIGLHRTEVEAQSRMGMVLMEPNDQCSSL